MERFSYGSRYADLKVTWPAAATAANAERLDRNVCRLRQELTACNQISSEVRSRLVWTSQRHVLGNTRPDQRSRAQRLHVG